ncbi:thioredoxin family protein [Stratiformator vulcanicus]|uniref:Thioredoxin C-1 n=1 Tax=Stratiformator vulcanicus TaxID=2527980 RepID=A0A517R6S5_9PLAN|nr:thioredoxin family protein [Stratiformator vulcanicus]QDT39542.1 Thioredoxin C-1 [Stratiformator vulcanicus]
MSHQTSAHNRSVAPVFAVSAVALLFGVGASFVLGGGVGKYWQRDFDTALQIAKRDQKPLLVHFYADWCVPCKRMEREVLHTDEVTRIVGQSVVGVQLNSDHNRDLASRFGVSSIPADVFVAPDGHVLGMMNGFRDKRDYVRRVTAIDDYFARTKKPDVGANEPDESIARGRTPGRRQPTVRDGRGKQSQLLGLRGFCPVTLHGSRQWTRGSKRFSVEHQGISYFCVSARAASRFREGPEQYAPRLLGCDPVIYFTTGKAVPGSVEHAAFYDEVLYLFAGAKTRSAFRDDPSEFMNRRAIVLLDEIDTTRIE